MTLLFVSFGVALTLCLFTLFVLLSGPSAESLLLAKVTERAYRADSTAAHGWLHIELLVKPFVWLRTLFGRSANPDLVKRLTRAGYREPYYADVFVGAKLILPVIIGTAVALTIRDNVIFWFALSLVAAFLVPDFWLMNAVKRYREQIRLALPDALDLLAICMEAGMGLDQAIVRVGTELKLSHLALSQELLLINLEQRAGNQRIGAWRNMADRVGVDNVRSFVNMLVQTERFGTPISKALNTFSDTLRIQRRQEAEEKAAKTTIKLVLPLVFFIFPSIFIVTVLPAVLTIMKNFGTVL